MEMAVEMPTPIDSKILAKTLGRNLKKLRESKGLTQAQLGEYLGVTVNAIASNEQGITFPKIPALIFFADFYGVAIDELLGREKITIDEKLYQKLYKLASLANMPVNDFVNKNLENVIERFYPTLIEVDNAENRAKVAVQVFIEGK